VNWLGRVFNLRRGEQAPVAWGFALFFLLFAGYFMLRPVRETMGIAGGVDNLQWLFTATFVSTLATLPLFGWLAAKARRRRILPWTYGFFALNLVLFGVLLQAWPDSAWSGRVFYVWLSVFNLIAISLAWSVLADLFTREQALRVFAVMAAGASAGGLAGPLLSVALVGVVGHAGLLYLSAALLVLAIVAAQQLQRWRDRHPDAGQRDPGRARPLGGNPFAGLTAVFRSPYLLAIAVFVLLLTSVNTFLYFDQARLVEATFPDRTQQTQVFGALDAIVQGLSVLTQLFLTGRIAQRLGVGVLLAGVPLVVALGFLAMAVAPGFWLFAVVMVVRRAGEYALVRPGREMLFTVVSPEQKYKAKNVIDAGVYRFGDVVSAWAKVGVDAMAGHPALAALAGAAIAIGWAGSGLFLARRQRALADRSVSS